ncbi:MAG TPA: c-type cytochrome [Woeseiaceae bacterium]|nr:c-type cytochrome [Woeseiaceae bacterium]
MRLSGFRWRRAARYGAAYLAAAIVAGALFVWSGLYNVAASSDHWEITNWLLERVRVESVDTWSNFVGEPPPLDNPALVSVGAAHFEGGCTPCHSRPGSPANAIAASMLPVPPPLTPSVQETGTKELFWIVKHGLKFTAMPAWPSQPRDDEVWAVTAFLLSLPDLSSREYRELSGVARGGEQQETSAELARSSEAVALTECVRCHGDASMPPLSAFIPLLNGQSQAYLERSLAEYAATIRPSGIMQPVASLLTPTERRRLAAWYAGLEPPRVPPGDGAEDVARGRQLAHEGDPENGIPPCLACHSAHHPGSFPSLAGQNSTYLAQQLNLFRNGIRDQTVYGQIMAAIASRLTKEQVESVALYFASLPPMKAPDGAEPVR